MNSGESFDALLAMLYDFSDEPDRRWAMLVSLLCHELGRMPHHRDREAASKLFTDSLDHVVKHESLTEH